MDFIGKQISINRQESVLSIVILSVKEKAKNIALLAWLFLWSVCGVIVFTQYFITSDLNIKAVIIVWLGFWIYFEYKIVRAYLWRKQGKELIKIKEGKMLYKKAISGKEKIKDFFLENIKNIRLIEIQENSFMEIIGNSYWTISGEKIAFDYLGSEIRLGLQLSDEDAKALIKLLKSKLSASE
jgi:hypothetical protein